MFYKNHKFFGSKVALQKWIHRFKQYHHIKTSKNHNNRNITFKANSNKRVSQKLSILCLQIHLERNLNF